MIICESMQTCVHSDCLLDCIILEKLFIYLSEAMENYLVIYLVLTY